MKIPSRVGTFFACLLVIVTITAEATQDIAFASDNYVLQGRTTHQVTNEVTRANSKNHRSSAGGLLDIVFVVNNAVVGFLLLRRVNNS
jgi:hypothetical protein